MFSFAMFVALNLAVLGIFAGAHRELAALEAGEEPPRRFWRTWTLGTLGALVVLWIVGPGWVNWTLARSLRWTVEAGLSHGALATLVVVNLALIGAAGAWLMTRLWRLRRHHRAAPEAPAR